MPESNRRHQAPEACALSAELIALMKDRVNLYHFVFFVKGDLKRSHTCITMTCIICVV